MTDEQTDDFDWGELGEQWWRDTGAQCRATETQIRFACARHAGASATGAARLAGYTDSPEDKSAIRQSGYKALRTTAVANMLALAAAEGQASPNGRIILDKTERAKKLSELVNSPDPTLSIRAIEALNKMEDRQIELGQSTENDGHWEDRWTRDMLQMPAGGLQILCVYVATMTPLSCLSLLHDVEKSVRESAFPDLWERAVKKYSINEQVWLQSKLDKPDYQLEDRIKIWREVGIEIAPKKSQPTEPTQGALR